MKIHKTFAVLACLAAPGATAMAEPASPAPPNTIDCAQFGKVGPITWNEKDTAVFDFGKMKGIHLAKTPIQPNAFVFEGSDLFAALDQKCGKK